jgi:hypothetical protein
MSGSKVLSPIDNYGLRQLRQHNRASRNMVADTFFSDGIKLATWYFAARDKRINAVVVTGTGVATSSETYRTLLIS